MLSTQSSNPGVLGSIPEGGDLGRQILQFFRVVFRQVMKCVSHPRAAHDLETCLMQVQSPGIEPSTQASNLDHFTTQLP